MKSRPWPIVIIALFHILAPLGNAIMHSLLRDVTITRYFELLLEKSSALEIFGELILIPAAGISLLMFRKWSYPIFLSAIGWATYKTAASWYYFPQTASPFVFALIILGDLVLVSYFLLPAVRAAYFDRSLRWWESKPRYPLNIDATIVMTDQGPNSKGKVINISEGGVFLNAKKEYALDSELILNFSFAEESYEFQGKVVRKMTAPLTGYGLQFNHTKSTKNAVRKLLKSLTKNGLLPRTPVDPVGLSFTSWLIKLTTTGKGFVPEIPESYRKNNSVTDQESQDKRKTI